jgi:uncharacterized protein DUF6894
MRCYFHVLTATGVIRDEEGIEVADLNHARAEALAALHEVREEDEAAGTEWQKGTLEVTDSAGAVLFSLPLDA